MTVRELRDKQAQFPDQTTIVVYWENLDQQKFFTVDDLTVPKGTMQRDAHGKPGFKFGGSGLAPCVFINVSPNE